MKTKLFINYRQLTDSATGKDASGNVTNITNKLLSSINDIKKVKMSMPNQWKFLSQLKDYLNKNYDKNQINLSKDWLDILQKLTYSQLETIRKLSSDSIKTIKTDASKTSDTKHKTSDIKDKESNDSEDIKLTFMSESESLVNNSTNIQPKTQQVIIYKLNQIKSIDLFYIKN